MIRIGILGDIGSGKSYIAKNFGYPVFNADKEVAKLYLENKKIFSELTKVLPKYIHSFPIKKKNRLKINTRLNIKTAERDKKCEISPIILQLDQSIAQEAYNFHHVWQRFLQPQTWPRHFRGQTLSESRGLVFHLFLTHRPCARCNLQYCAP